MLRQQCAGKPRPHGREGQARIAFPLHWKRHNGRNALLLVRHPRVVRRVAPLDDQSNLLLG